ncbi:hypothetical protein V2J09_011730 [Rumex salicifolius]
MRISQKEKIQLGYDPNSPPKTPSRSPDIDFSDVFGGPPRRASHQEMQNRYSGDNNDDTWPGDGEGNSQMTTGRSSSWSINRGEKPVFGSEIASRRRYQTQDFYDDIFRGDQSQCSSPRMSGRDPMSSTPGSRVLSPTRPLPPGTVPLGSPAQFSLPARLPTSHSFSNLSRQSPLSHKAFADREGSRKDENLDEIGGETQVKNAGNQFHFSIHKWASKGVPLVMSLGKKNSLRSKIMLERSLSLNDNGEVESDALVGEIQPSGVNTDDVLSFTVHVVSAAKDSKDTDQIVEKSETDVPKLRTVSKKSASKEMKNVSKPDIDASKSVLKKVSSKLDGVEKRTGNDNAIPEVTINKTLVENESAASSNVDKKVHIEEVGKSMPKEQSSLKDDSKKNNVIYQKNLGYDLAKEKVKNRIVNNKFTEKVKGDTEKDEAKGKVKEFVKIFNKEPSIKTIADVDNISPSGRWRNVDVPRENSKTTLSSAKTDGKMQGFDMNYSFVSSPKVDESHTPSSGKQFDAKNVQEPYQSSFMESENLGYTMASDGIEASSADIDVTAFDSILIEELPQIQDKTSENSENTEDMQAYESKILKWSKGKEGNIRALLSTLQYVLWPDSGWKPVPLVNIIEANAVKRSYQRALLYLHPDKLQQKGAAPYQKFIAEKVFDILQVH